MSLTLPVSTASTAARRYTIRNKIGLHRLNIVGWSGNSWSIASQMTNSQLVHALWSIGESVLSFEARVKSADLVICSFTRNFEQKFSWYQLARSKGKTAGEGANVGWKIENRGECG